MLLEIHMLQNFAPSNLNRDDTGAPKDCEFGGYRRARISSQCLKRAIRSTFQAEALLKESGLTKEDLGARTRLLVQEVARRLAQTGHDEEAAKAVVEAALSSIGIPVEKSHKSKYLLFLGSREISALTEVCHTHWDALAAAATPLDDTQGQERKQRGAKKKGDGAAAIPSEVSRAVGAVLDGGKAVDLALFGRMLANLPDKEKDAACQVAHAISTNRVSMEFDFFTAVDDFQQDDDKGAPMMGTVEFNSSCYYRYANVDVVQLARNLGDDGLVVPALTAFLKASVLAVPSGKQNSTAPQNPPNLVYAVARSSGLWSLANAFVQPVHPGREGNLVEASVKALDDYWGRLAAMYGTRAILGQWVCTLEKGALPNLQSHRVGTIDELVAKAVDTAKPAGARS